MACKGGQGLRFSVWGSVLTHWDSWRIPQISRNKDRSFSLKAGTVLARSPSTGRQIYNNSQDLHFISSYICAIVGIIPIGYDKNLKLNLCIKKHSSSIPKFPVLLLRAVFFSAGGRLSRQTCLCGLKIFSSSLLSGIMGLRARLTQLLSFVGKTFLSDTIPEHKAKRTTSLIPDCSD